MVGSITDQDLMTCVDAEEDEEPEVHTYTEPTDNCVGRYAIKRTAVPRNAPRKCEAQLRPRTALPYARNAARSARRAGCKCASSTYALRPVLRRRHKVGPEQKVGRPFLSF